MARSTRPSTSLTALLIVDTAGLNNSWVLTFLHQVRTPRVCSKAWTISLFSSLTRQSHAKTQSKLSSCRQEQTRYPAWLTGSSLLATVSLLTKSREVFLALFQFQQPIRKLEIQAFLSTTWSAPTQQILPRRLTALNLEGNLVFSSPRFSRPRLTATFLLSRLRNSSEKAWSPVLQLCFLL